MDWVVSGDNKYGLRGSRALRLHKHFPLIINMIAVYFRRVTKIHLYETYYLSSGRNSLILLNVSKRLFILFDLSRNMLLNSTEHIFIVNSWQSVGLCRR